jgi:solute carrier family 13 (sodium-dependent dicarboxylate transporter), member 2/3/5
VNRSQIGLIAGLFLLVMMLVLPTPEGLSDDAMRAGGVTLLMACWWMTEAIPISATALVPLAAFPLLGVLDAKTTAANYGHNYVLMLLAGFFIAKAFETHGVHRRIALVLINRIGTSRKRIVLSFMIATAVLSMWIANVAVTLLMLPIALAVATKEEEADGGGSGAFGLCLMLAVAHAASIGGTGSLVGTPPNMVFVGMVKTMYEGAPEISFFEWMQIGLPFVILFIPITWLYLTWFHGIKGQFSGSRELITNELNALGKPSPAEKRVMTVFVLTGLGWIFRKDLLFGPVTLTGWSSLLGVENMVHDATVAVLAAIALFLIPAGPLATAKRRLITWPEAQSVPWGVVLIVGGGYAIAKSFTQTGLADWLGVQLAFIGVLPMALIIILVILFMTFVTEINSNTATANIFLPVLATMAVAGQMHPFLLMIPATFACSCAFMLPSGTGPNAVIFGSGKVTIPEMSKTGFWLNILSVVVLSIIMIGVAVPVLNLTMDVPVWAK